MASDSVVSPPIKHDARWNISRVSLEWFTKTGNHFKLCNITDSHLIFTAVKIERDGMPQKMGANNGLQMYQHLIREIDYRGLNAQLDDQRIADAKQNGDVRRLVKAVKIKEEHQCSPKTTGKS